TIIKRLQVLVLDSFLCGLVPGSFIEKNFQGERNDSCRSLADVILEFWNTVRGIRATSTIDSFAAEVLLCHECRIETVMGQDAVGEVVWEFFPFQCYVIHVIIVVY